MTGGHWLDTDSGPGPVLLDAAEPAPAEDPERAHETAWTAYRRHLAGCTRCQTRVLRCPAGEELWSAFDEAFTAAHR